ncbi:MAG: type II secretion system F family protein, partial [Thermofilaceae archaeon]
MPYVPLKGRWLLLLTTISVALSLVPLAFLALLWEEWTWEVETFELLRGLELFWSISIYDLVFLIPVCAIAPFAVIQYMNGRYVDAIERSMSSFFKGVADGIRSGMPMVKSLEVTARSISGPLGREMLDVVSAVELGSSLERALENMLDRVATPGLKRAANLLITAYRSGGRVADVLDAAAEMYEMIGSYEEERRSSLAPYVWTVYVALAVFLTISTILVPDALATRSFKALTAGEVAQYGMVMPKASDTQAMVFAVNMPSHEPHVGHEASSSIFRSCGLNSPLAAFPT